jgi:uncharacterized membrane protein
MSEKLSKVALEAAEKSTEISTKWTKDTLAKLGEMTVGQGRAGRLHQGDDRFRIGAGRNDRRNMAAFAEVAKKVQMETVELMMAAGKDISEDATAAVKKATAEVTSPPRRPLPPKAPDSQDFARISSHSGMNFRRADPTPGPPFSFVRDVR